MNITAQSLSPVQQQQQQQRRSIGGRAHLIFAFSLVSAALARIVMQILGTRLLDADVANEGVAIAAVVGALTSLVLHALRDREGWRRRVWALIPIAGAIVGMITQGLLLVNRPSYRFYVVGDGINSNNPVAWVLTGAPFGAFPALVAGLLLWIALRVTSRGTPSNDARERMIVPLAGGCAVLHAVSLYGAASTSDFAVILLVLALSVLSLTEVFFADLNRVAWVRSVFAGDHAGFSLENISNDPTALSVPLVVGGIEKPSLLVVSDLGEQRASYRAAARQPFAAVAATVTETIAPIIRRRLILAGLLSATALTSVVALLLRQFVI